MQTYGVEASAVFRPGNVDPRYERWPAFTGTSVTLDDEQRYLDSQLAYQRAILHAIDYLTTFGYTPEQAYLSDRVSRTRHGDACGGCPGRCSRSATAASRCLAERHQHRPKGMRT